MKQYHDALRTVLQDGVVSTDRTGTGTISYFGLQTRYDLQKGFPLVTTKKLHLKSIIHELLWFLKGDTNIRYLQENGVRIWDEWADKDGDLGPVYGSQWRMWRGDWEARPYLDEAGKPVDDGHYNAIDQISGLIDDIRNKPDSRRLLVSAWNPAEVKHMALPPCHTMWQVRIQGELLHLHLSQRSGDMFLGIPFNIASYAMLQTMLAHVTGYKPGTFIHTIGDAHIYSNHLEQVNTLLERTPRELPALKIARDVPDIDSFRFEDFIIEGYDPYPTISAPVAV